MIFLLLVFLFVFSEAQLSGRATLLYGQTDFFSASQPPPSSTSFFRPQYIIRDSKGNLYISDTTYNRVLRYPPNSNIADLVYGQPDFSSVQENRGNAQPSADSLLAPNGLAVDSDDRLYISDTFNHRVLVFSFGSTSATLVYGQPNMVSKVANNGGVSSTSLSFPNSITIDGNDRLYVSDNGNYRILRYPKLSSTADQFYGQVSFATNVNNNVASDTNIGKADQIHIDQDGFLWMTQSFFNRVIKVSLVSKKAIEVYGQPDFTSTSGSDVRGISASAFSSPSGVYTLGQGNNLKLFISDINNNRILYFEGLSKIPTLVIGQPSSTTGTPNRGGRSFSTLSLPGAILATSENDVTLYASDTGNFRVLGYQQRGLGITTSGNGGTNAPGGGEVNNVCFHSSTNLSFLGNKNGFTFKDIQDTPSKFKTCRIAHFVTSTGVKLVFEEGYQLQVTPNHLIAHRKRDYNVNFYLEAHKIKKTHKVQCQSPKGYCTLKEMIWMNKTDLYFGLNCLESNVYANGIVASTFENYHYLPALWMRVVGNLFGIEKASQWGDHIANWAYKNNLI